MYSIVKFLLFFFFFFFFNDTATTEIYTLSLHDALPIPRPSSLRCPWYPAAAAPRETAARPCCGRSEEHTSELPSPVPIVCRLLLEKNKYTCHLYISVWSTTPTLADRALTGRV